MFVVVCLNLYGNFTFFCFIRCWHNDKWLVIGFCLLLMFNLILDIIFEIFYLVKFVIDLFAFFNGVLKSNFVFRSSS